MNRAYMRRHSTARDRADQRTDRQLDQLFAMPLGRSYFSGAAVLNSILYERAKTEWQRAHRKRPRGPEAWKLRAGWEIGPDYFNRFAQDPTVVELRTFIDAEIAHFIASVYLTETHFDHVPKQATFTVPVSWATATRAGAFQIDEHVHYGADLIAIYYVKVPPNVTRDDSNGAGHLILRDPRSALHACRMPGQRTVAVVAPVEGLLLICPAYVPHAVRPFSGSGERMSINMNIRISITQP